jgi:general secretion pathway protein B
MPAVVAPESPSVAAQQTAAPNITTAEPAVAVAPARGTAIATAPPPAPVVRDEAVDKLYQHRDLEEEPPGREIASPARQRALADSEAAAPESVDVDRILAEARDEMENASLEEHPAPFLADLSQRTKDGIPTLYYQRHDYSSDTSQSSVTLNGTPVKTGGSVVPGMKVDEILPDSVVLNYQGTQFRLRALNSWVNL